MARFPQRASETGQRDARDVELWVFAFEAKETRIAIRSCTERLAARCSGSVSVR